LLLATPIRINNGSEVISFSGPSYDIMLALISVDLVTIGLQSIHIHTYTLLALAAWRSGHLIRLSNKKTRV
jgi:hypothetical protein